MAIKRRFEAQHATILRDLRSIMAKMDATSLRISQEAIGPPLAEVVFDRAGKRFVFRCQKYAHPDDNLRAVQLTIDYLWRALETYGTTREEADAAPLNTRQKRQREAEAAFGQLFGTFQPLPDDTVLLIGDGATNWWEVLGVARDADRRAIENAFKALARIHHPDTGGSSAAFVRLRRAYEAGIAAVAA